MINLNEGPDHRVVPHVLTHTTLIVWPGKRKSTCWDILSGTIFGNIVHKWLNFHEWYTARRQVLCLENPTQLSHVASFLVRWEGHQIGGRQWPWRRLGVSVGHCGVQNNQNTKLGGSAVRSGDVNNSWRRRGPYRFGAQVLTWGRRARRGQRASQTEMWNQTVRRGFATVLAVWIFVCLNHVVSCCFYIQFLVCNGVMDTLISHVARASW